MGILCIHEKSHPVHVVFGVGDFFLESFSLSDADNEFGGLGILEGKVLDHGPMVEHALWESFSLCVSSESSGETEGFGDWQIGFQLNIR